MTSTTSTTPDSTATESLDIESLDAALHAADLRVLVACLFHLTGDERWLADDLRPRRDVRLIADPSAGYDDETAAMIRSEVREWLLAEQATPVILDPGPERFGEMLSFFLGEQVPPEYEPMVRHDFGFDASPATSDEAESTAGARRRVIIVGSGVSGLCLAHRLDEAGFDWHIVEKNPDLGGTWFDNRYPGCGVDTPNHFYSFSFASNPDWTHYFSAGDELREYLQTFAANRALRDRIEFGASVTAAEWDAERNQWSVTIESPTGTRVEDADVVVTATGHFNQPVSPTFAGTDEFEGEIVHTAHWPEDLDLTGKRVAVIGTGASAMQLVPTIADSVAALTIFQRTPQWARPVPEYHLSVEPEAAWLFRNVPMYDRWYRFSQMWRYGDGLLRFLRRDPDWEHADRSLNKTNERHRVEIETFIRDELDGRDDLIAKCIPSYPPFAKRILIDNGWFKTLRLPHVELVTEPIADFTASGVRSADGTVHDADVVVFATGFDVTNLAARIDFIGAEGRRLADDWADENPRALLGMTVPDFPNLFVMYGPNTNMGHGGSGMWLAETQADYIVARLRDMAQEGLAAIDCLPARRDEYTEQIDQLHAELVWTHPGTETYYRNTNGQVRSPMPFRLVDYWTMTRTRGLEDFETTPLPASTTEKGN